MPLNVKKLQLLLIIFLALLNNCGIYKKVDKSVPVSGEERARQNVQQGRGISLGNIGKTSSTTYDFSTSNPMWKATLEILDFLPLSTVDYSGGVIITDWYNDNLSQNNYIKITVRFLSNEIGSNNIKIIVHERNCPSSNNCRVKEINSKIKQELIAKILKTAAILDKDQKSKKK